MRRPPAHDPREVGNDDQNAQPRLKDKQRGPFPFSCQSGIRGALQEKERSLLTIHSRRGSRPGVVAVRAVPWRPESRSVEHDPDGAGTGLDELRDRALQRLTRSEPRARDDDRRLDDAGDDHRSATASAGGVVDMWS